MGQLLSRTELKAFTPLTKTDPDQLVGELAKVRSQGFAVIDQELELGLCSIAVPLRNDHGMVVAALNIGAPAAQFGASQLADLFLEPLLTMSSTLRPMLQ